GRQLTGADLSLREVGFAHAAPADITPHAELFRARLRFGSAANELVFAAKDLGLPVRTANPGLNKILVRYMTELLKRLPKDDSFIERARSAVAHRLVCGRPTLETT